MKRSVAALAALATTSVAGCATTPAVVMSYYQTKSTTQVTVTETVQCAVDKSTVVSVATVSPTTTYAADTSKEPLRFDIGEVADWYADNDLKFTFTNDGRLQSVNAVSTGHGEDIVKAAVTLATSAGGLKLYKAVVNPCPTIDSLGGGKPLTLTYSLEKPIDLATAKEWNPLLPDQPTKVIEGQLAGHIPTYRLHVLPPGKRRPPVYVKKADEIMAVLPINDTASVPVTVEAKTPGSQQDEIIYEAEVVVPLPDLIQLPVPKSAIFGQQTFALTLDDSGAITSIQYAKQSGFASGLTAASDVTTAAAPPTDAQHADKVKGQADLIAQQQRLANCRADPTTCTP